MTSLDDRLYQLFSDLLKNSKQHDELVYNNQTLTTGDGPYLSTPDGKKVLYLGPRASVLGHGHPLTYKGRLQSSLSPEIFCSEVEQEKLVNDLTLFMQSLTGLKIYVSLGLERGITTYDLGRHSDFISSISREHLTKGKVVLIPNLFPFPLYLHNAPSSSSTGPFLTKDSLISAKHLLKLLSLGDFYGQNGHIHRISCKLKDELACASRVKEVDGLLIHLEQDRNYSFLDYGQSTIYLPLFFRPSFIEELKKIIME